MDNDSMMEPKKTKKMIIPEIIGIEKHLVVAINDDVDEDQQPLKYPKF